MTVMRLQNEKNITTKPSEYKYSDIIKQQVDKIRLLEKIKREILKRETGAAESSDIESDADSIQDFPIVQQKSRVHRNSGTNNLYSGYTLDYKECPVDRIDAKSITPEQFFKKYVAQRRPVILSGHIADKAFCILFITIDFRLKEFFL